MTTGFSQQTLEAIASGEPGWLKSQRLAAWQAFEKLPLPSRRDLQWQRFDIRALKLDKVALSVETPAIRERLAKMGVHMGEVSLEPLGLQTWRVNGTVHG